MPYWVPDILRDQSLHRGQERKIEDRVYSEFQFNAVDDPSSVLYVGLRRVPPDSHIAGIIFT